MKRGVTYTCYRFYDDETPKVLRIEYNTKKLVHAFVKTRRGEVDIINEAYSHAYEVWTEGRDITKEEYDAFIPKC